MELRRLEAFGNSVSDIASRRNGQCVLQITGHPEYAVPFGPDRIGPTFRATLALEQKYHDSIPSSPAVTLFSRRNSRMSLCSATRSYRCFSACDQERIPLSRSLGLAAQLGNPQYARPCNFRETLQAWLHIVKPMWPACPATISADGPSFLIEPAATPNQRSA